jgi:hypothetical protein
MAFARALVGPMVFAVVAACGNATPDASGSLQAGGGEAGNGGASGNAGGVAGIGGATGIPDATAAPPLPDASGSLQAGGGAAGNGGANGNAGGVAGIGGATGIPDATAAPPVSRVPTDLLILFESWQYVWGPPGMSSTSTIYVLSDGTVWRHDDRAPLAGDAAAAQPIPAPLAKVGFAGAQVATVDPTTLASKYGLLGLARRGSLVFDLGVVDGGWWSDGVLYDGDAGAPRYVPLNGDNVANTTAEARALAGWLQSLGGAPTATVQLISCVGAPCTGAPGCSADEVPMTSDLARGCLDFCGAAGNCDVVDSCGACAGRICVVDRTGQPYCSRPSQYDTACTGTYNCECAGDAVCAGGKADCRGSVATGFTCAAP